MKDVVTVDSDTSLSLSAVGLWHKLFALYGTQFDRVDVITVHPDPNAWGPFAETHDLEGPLTELEALGYVHDNDGRCSLFRTRQTDSDCDACGGFVSPNSYCAECGLISG